MATILLIKYKNNIDQNSKYSNYSIERIVDSLETS